MLNKNIKNIRKNKGLSQEQLAKNTGLTRRMISAIERNESKPSLKQINILANFFGVTTSYLINGQDGYDLSNIEREIIKAIRNDNGLLDSLMKIIESKKHIEALAIY